MEKEEERWIQTFFIGNSISSQHGVPKEILEIEPEICLKKVAQFNS